MQLHRGVLHRVAIFVLCVSALIGCLSPAFAESITVEGNHRVDAETIRSYFTGTDSAHVAEGVKGLKATGLFTSVRAQQGRGGLVV